MAKEFKMKRLRDKGKAKGRPPGSINKNITEIRDLLEPHRKQLIDKAVKLALEGNAVIMNKLLDKLLPNLNAIDLNGNAGLMPEIKINVIPNTGTN